MLWAGFGMDFSFMWVYGEDGGYCVREDVGFVYVRGCIATRLNKPTARNDLRKRKVSTARNDLRKRGWAGG